MQLVDSFSESIEVGELPIDVREELALNWPFDWAEQVFGEVEKTRFWRRWLQRHWPVYEQVLEELHGEDAALGNDLLHVARYFSRLLPSKSDVERASEGDPRIVELFVWDSGLSLDTLMRALRLSAALEAMALRRHDIDTSTMQRLIEAIARSTLQQVQVTSRCFGPQAVQRLLSIHQQQRAPCLRMLHLHLAPIGNEGLRLLLQHPTLENLCAQYADVDHVSMTSTNSSLQKLDLSHNRLDSEAARALGQIGTLHTLVLDANDVGNEGLEALLFDSPSLALHQLSVANNGITDIGVRWRDADNSTMLTLETLNLSTNDVVDDAALMLYHCPRSLQRVDLSFNIALGSETLKILQRSHVFKL